MVDIHAHILPGVDDGARSWETAVAMCRMAAQDGITHIVATPHANDEYNYDRAQLQQLLSELAKKVGDDLALSLGCDFHFSFDNLQQLRDDPANFCIGDTSYLLIELSEFSIPPWISTQLLALLQMGLRPIITHPERNLLLQKNPGQVLEWAKIGCVIQVTANSLTGRWGEKAVQVSRWLLEKQALHIVASDCHNLEGRPPVLSRAREYLKPAYGVEIAEALVMKNPQAVVAGLDIPYFPQPLS